MSLIFKGKGQGNVEIPEGAVQITEDQAIRYQMKLISEWPKFSDVFVLKSGTGILGGMAMVSSYIINNHFRWKLKLGSYGRLSSYLTVVATPVMISGLFHTMFIQSHVILRKYECPLCLQTQAAAFQAATAVVYPFFLAPCAAFAYATRHFTYRLPSVTTQPKEVLKLWLKFTRSARTKASVLLGLNMFAAMLITSMEMSEHTEINLQLFEYEKKFESGSLPEQQSQESGQE